MEPATKLDGEARAEMRRAFIDEQYFVARRRYISVISAVLINIEDWLAIDSWLGGGKVTDFKESSAQDRSSIVAFRAVAAVVCMSADLCDAAESMVEKHRYYAVGAVARQLIECEYLLTLFNEDLAHADRWAKSTRAEIRNVFSPAKMRKLTGRFSNEEYWNHCSTGGHPAPSGIKLLEKMDPSRRTWPFTSAELLIDLGLHLRRIWVAIDQLLIKYHVRYGKVRDDQRQEAERAWAAWQEDDPLVAAMIEAWDGTSHP